MKDRAMVANIHPTESEHAVVARGVTKEFGSGDTGTLALRGVDLDIAYGETTLLVGPSGCGKTTLISIIAGLLNPTDGEVSVLGHDFSELRVGVQPDRALIIVTHDSRVYGFGDRIVHMSDGRIERVEEMEAAAA